MDSKLNHLLNAAIDGEADHAQMAELQALLACEQDQEKLLEFLSLHVALAERCAPVRPFSAAELDAVMEVEDRFRNAGPLSSSAATHHSSRQFAAKPGNRWWPRRWSGFAAGLAVSLLFVLPLAWRYVAPPQFAANAPNHSPRQPLTHVDTSAIAARIVKKIDCVWDNDRWMVAPPVSFRAGERISLSSGLLVLEFDSGATVTLEGPATATAVSDNALSLYTGIMTANVPDKARGFTVQTSSGEIVDLGTEFGVVASEDGAVEAHVFKGEVVTNLGLARKIDSPPLSLTAGRAQLVSASGTAITSSAQASRFPRMGFGLDTPIADHPPVDRGLVLWLAADGRLQLDERGKVMAWGDNPTDNNRNVEDAWQVHANKRPAWSPNAINGKPGLRFGGKAVLVSEPIEMDCNQTIVAVFRLDPQKVPLGFKDIQAGRTRGERPRPDLGLQLLNLYGPPHPVMQVDSDLTISARVHLGRDPNTNQDMNIGVEFTEPIMDHAGHVVIYTFDSQAKIARLYLDGRLVSVMTDAPPFAATYTPRYVGNHPYRPFHGFPGDIGEVMLFDAALDSDEASGLSNWLGAKYDIPIQPLSLEE